MRSGSVPMVALFAAYHCGQAAPMSRVDALRPRCSRAMDQRQSPTRTTYDDAGTAARRGLGATAPGPAGRSSDGADQVGAGGRPSAHAVVTAPGDKPTTGPMTGPMTGIVATVRPS